MVKAETKEAVIREIARVIRDSRRAGMKDYQATQEAERVFPGTPYMVIVEAVCLVDMQDESDWWEQVESTIDAEVVRNSLRLVGGEGA